MKRLHLIVILAFLSIGMAISLSAPSHAASTYYVATTGSDAGNDCTDMANPCATVNHAIDQAADGDTINIAAGASVGCWTEEPASP